MKVLLGIGGSEDSIQALEKTVDRAESAGDNLTVAILQNPNADRTPDEIESQVREYLTDHTIESSIRHVEGDPGSMLVDIAESEGYEKIVIGGGQRSPMGKIQLGQIAEFVLLNSHTTVTLVR
ncbi:universal stress protein [Halalkalirubrum salinum]|uniref:universal stress protein n=1 Tax=Halalkalirubrum salinum TaxID=2563889 RepID=UPI0010FB3D19|nr:universal stress protein [Halalkalirubrum salinum]